MMGALNALASRCEAAVGPDRELDVAIARAAAPETLGHAIGYRDDWLVLPVSPCKRYTASLDAALTLVPENWKFRQAIFSAPCADERKWNAQLHGGREGEDCFTAFADAPALALCAAALRARAAQETEARSGETERLDPKGDGPVAKPCA